MRRTSFAAWPCSIARTMDLLGDAWTPLIVREAFYGIRRFDEFQRELGIARNTLVDRLARLVDQGVLAKQLYSTEPKRYEYVLTEMGQDFFGVISAMNRWGDTWLSEAAGPPVVYHHETCGHDMQVEVVCGSCHEPVRAADVTVHMGPGYPARLRQRPDIQRRFARAGAPGLDA